MPCILVHNYQHDADYTSCLYCSNVCKAAFPIGCDHTCDWPQELRGCSLRSECPCFADSTTAQAAAIHLWISQFNRYVQKVASQNRPIMRRRSRERSRAIDSDV